MATNHIAKLLDDLSAEFLECPICRNPFDENMHTPRYYPCTHTTCEQCMTHQFLQSSTYERVIRCPLCLRVYQASSPDVLNYEKNNILRDLKSFISTKEKEEFCDKCPNKFADAYCKDCDSSLCRSCSEAIHIGNNSSHNMMFKDKKLQVDACHFCLKQSDIFCPNCKIFFCKACRNVHHSDETVGIHKVCITNPEYIPYIPLEVSFMQKPREIVEPVNMVCQHRTKEEVYQNTEISKKQVHRTVCTFNVFHYNLLSRNRTYFVLDIDIDIAKTYRYGRVGKLFTIKLFHLNKEHNTHHKQRNMYLSVSRCKTENGELAMCLEDISYKKETQLTQRLISTVVMKQIKRVSFLFLVDNEKKIMEIFTPVMLWKDVVFLEHYYESKTLSVWISLADSKNDKYITARIRSGADITIVDLPNPAVVTNYQIVHRVLTYPFRCLYAYLWNAILPLPIPNENNEKETLHP
ncbi:uncharacterized protein LOC110467130 isoform X2 [Mizuhopecten yessoensis]|uniref:uncharacterized protein LOC110467130 isoform X2 n=1 Tax=Mizuhopecten yessoensis TaxID=6573 RepID=UPI000B45B4FE|nr:uncharacterized protein LOC110467130 isoform X2 [Mizuhopecten yessoensis]